MNKPPESKDPPEDMPTWVGWLASEIRDVEKHIRLEFKSETSSLRSDLKRDMNDLRLEFKSDIKELRDQGRWAVGIILALFIAGVLWLDGRITDLDERASETTTDTIAREVRLAVRESMLDAREAELEAAAHESRPSVESGEAPSSTNPLQP